MAPFPISNFRGNPPVSLVPPISLLVGFPEPSPFALPMLSGISVPVSGFGVSDAQKDGQNRKRRRLACELLPAWVGFKQGLPKSLFRWLLDEWYGFKGYRGPYGPIQPQHALLSNHGAQLAHNLLPAKHFSLIFGT